MIAAFNKRRAIFPGERDERVGEWTEPFRHFNYVTPQISRAPSVASATSRLIPQPFRSIALPTSQALHLRHLASRPWIVYGNNVDVLREKDKEFIRVSTKNTSVTSIKDSGNVNKKSSISLMHQNFQCIRNKLNDLINTVLYKYFKL